MHAELKACMRKLVGACMWVLGACLWSGWVQSMGNLGACIWKLLGACMRILGASIWSGWVHVCGCWVQSMRLLGACLTVGSYCLHAYPTSWAQGPPGPWPKGSRPRPLAIKKENKYMLKKNMGPMGPRGLGPWALWAPGALGPN